MSGWPISTSAATPLVVGIEFQINTRLYPRSLTNRCVPSEVTETGSNMLEEVALVDWFATAVALYVVKLGAPTTTSAPTPFVVGMEFQINTRLFCVSATNSLPFCIHTPCGPRSELAVGSVLIGSDCQSVKVFCPTTTSAGALL